MKDRIPPSNKVPMPRPPLLIKNIPLQFFSCWSNKFRISENETNKSRHLKADTRVVAMDRSAKESLSPTRKVRCAKVSFSIANLTINIKVTVWQSPFFKPIISFSQENRSSNTLHTSDLWQASFFAAATIPGWIPSMTAWVGITHPSMACRRSPLDT